MLAEAGEVIIAEEKICTCIVCLQNKIPAGQILTDNAERKWKLGNFLSRGGFGSVYLVSRDVLGAEEKYVVKLAAYKDSTLYREIDFYRSAARFKMTDYCKENKLNDLGIPCYVGSGIHVYRDHFYRFLILPRYDTDIFGLHQILSMDFVNSLVVQMLYALEYIHAKGFSHNDVKAKNIVLRSQKHRELGKNQAMIIDFGLVSKFRTSQGLHKPYLSDRKRAHRGTLLFTSCDSHQGAYSRRGDLESLGYNLITWLGGQLPWSSLIQQPFLNFMHLAIKKEQYLKNLDLFFRECFQDKEPPIYLFTENLTTFMEYCINLRFNSKPDYTYLRSLFRKDTNLEHIFGCGRLSHANVNYVSIETNTKSYNLRKRRGKENKEETKKENNDDFDWQSVIASHPEKLAKIRTRPALSPVAAAHLPSTPTIKQIRA
ncbi:serine/threonine-protein kinase VRK1-like isoform X2 [Nasonia vitripennis]|uniref:non-specific serine/threonine protein kinase n=1 Tax=Nasonia vitripennis TaxID=7425 RepID=A0A7M7Q0D8_NASVI|nr:serine/threonine-protein kinase VRK1-like isoform X2 [Nasonia vitripennis]